MSRYQLAIAVLLCGACSLAQVTTPQADDPPRIPSILDLERDRGVTLAIVDGKKIRLGDLAKHLERYAPDIVARWSDTDGSRELNSPDLPQLLYQYVDVVCLRNEAEQKSLRLADLDKLIERKIAESFASYVKVIQARASAAGDGAPPLTKRAIAFYRKRHRREQGLRSEIAALLDLLVPPRYTSSELRQWHYENGDVFGGQVKFAHIFFALRDPRTGRVKSPAERRRARTLAWDVYRRAKKDPGTFADLARAHSEDTKTRNRGGEFKAWAKRTSPRLPVALSRTAWNLPNGGISEPVESYYGIHVVRRLKQVVNRYILFYGKTIDRITKMRSRIHQEDFIFEMRKRHSIKRFL